MLRLLSLFHSDSSSPAQCRPSFAERAATRGSGQWTGRILETPPVYCRALRPIISPVLPWSQRVKTMTRLHGRHIVIIAGQGAWNTNQGRVPFSELAHLNEPTT